MNVKNAEEAAMALPLQILILDTNIINLRFESRKIWIYVF